MNTTSLKKLCQLLRYDIVTSTTAAGSGHPTSSLSAVELMGTLFFNGYFHFDFKNPANIYNDRLIFSKGHASPLYYALYHAAGVLKYKDLLTLRMFDSVLEGHPTPRFKYTEAATGSLGQGFSVGVGMALGMKLHLRSALSVQGSSRMNHKNYERLTMNYEPKVFVLLGDSEMAEGQVWEAMEIASYYKLSNLVAILDVNRLGQRGETMLGWNLKTYQKRAEAFGWSTIVIRDGHDLSEVNHALGNALTPRVGPVMIIAKTVKGKGVSFFENKDDWHGKALPKDKLEEALKDIGKVDGDMKGEVAKPTKVMSFEFDVLSETRNPQHITHDYPVSTLVATREAYGAALANLGAHDPSVVVLDAETSNSTYADAFQKKFPERFFEMYIAEQNMVSVALGLSKLGFIPYSSTFAAFLTRAFDQIRMSQYSEGNVKIAGSHAGVSIGYDGSSQMGLEDLSMFRSVHESTVFYPSDAVSAYALVVKAREIPGIVYIRTTREKTPILYDRREQFEVGGSKILRQNRKDKAVVFTAGITLHESLKAYEELLRENIHVCVVDLYSVKPIDKKTIEQESKRAKNVIVVEDHYPTGGLGEAVLAALSKIEDRPSKINFVHLAVNKVPRSGSPAELLAYEEIDAMAIIKAVKKSISLSVKGKG